MRLDFLSKGQETVHLKNKKKNNLLAGGRLDLATLSHVRLARD